MPTLLFIRGWRFFCYSNERNEPPHVHIRKGDSECKFWLLEDKFDIEQAYAYKISPADMRFIRQTLFENFDYLVSEYLAIQKGESHE